LDDERPLAVVRELKQDVERFREKMWLVELLTTEAITKKPQVWREVFKECEVSDLDVNEELTLQSLLDNRMAEF
jgi:dynein heavy chain